MYSDQDTLAGGFPHSEIRGSKLTRSSPRLIAACHVLHRLSMPRHPPNALMMLDLSVPRAGTIPPLALNRSLLDRPARNCLTTYSAFELTRRDTPEHPKSAVWDETIPA